MYPALEIKKAASIAPIKTYVSLDGHIGPEDKKLICLYYLRDDKEYKEFEKIKLKGNKLFEKFIEVADEPPKGIYIFNFDKYDKDWALFLKGRYSKLSKELREKIKDHYRHSDNNYTYVESFLHPNKYYSLYAEILGVDVETLKSVGELTDPPDMEKEALKISMERLGITTDKLIK